MRKHKRGAGNLARPPNKRKDNKMSKFKVFIDRTAWYHQAVVVDAADAAEARKVAERHYKCGFYDGLFTRPEKTGEVFSVQLNPPVSDDAAITAMGYGNPEETDDGTTYTLPELADKVDIDSWVEGISAMCAMDEIRKEVYDMAGMVEDEDNPICPAEFETEYTALAEKYDFRFNRKGQIVSYDMTGKR